MADNLQITDAQDESLDCGAVERRLGRDAQRSQGNSRYGHGART